MTRLLRISAGTTLFVALVITLLLPTESPANDRMERRAQVSALLKKSRGELAAGQYQSALASLLEAKGIDPNNQDAYYLTAVAHLALKDTLQARAVLTEGAEKAPLSSRIKLLLARVHLHSAEYDEAEQLLSAVFRFKPNNEEAMYLSGLVSLARGDTTRTLEVWQAALDRLQAKEPSR